MLRQSQTVKRTKVLHGGESFNSVEEFPAGQLPTKRQVIERLLHEDSYLQKQWQTKFLK